MVEEGYIRDEDQRLTIGEYNRWVATDAQGVVMQRKEVRGSM